MELQGGPGAPREGQGDPGEVWGDYFGYFGLFWGPLALLGALVGANEKEGILAEFKQIFRASVWGFWLVSVRIPI